MNFLSLRCANEIWPAGLQALARAETDKIFRRFDFVFEVFVLRFDVIDRFLWSVRLPVANKSSVRVGDVIEEVVDRIVQ